VLACPLLWFFFWCDGSWCYLDGSWLCVYTYVALSAVYSLIGAYKCKRLSLIEFKNKVPFLMEIISFLYPALVGLILLLLVYGLDWRSFIFCYDGESVY